VVVVTVAAVMVVAATAVVVMAAAMAVVAVAEEMAAVEVARSGEDWEGGREVRVETVAVAKVAAGMAGQISWGRSRRSPFRMGSNHRMHRGRHRHTVHRM